MLRNKALLLFLFLFVFAAPVRAAQDNAWLIKEGMAQGRLFLPETSGAPLRFAVSELQAYLKKMTGTELPLAWRQPETRWGHEDSGLQLVVRPEADWKGKETAQAFTIEGDISGRKRRMVVITGNTETAVLYGVYQYLQELGVRWFIPGEAGENVPLLKDIPIRKKKRAYSPSFINRVMDFSAGRIEHFPECDDDAYAALHYDYDLWLMRNRLIFERSIHNGHLFNFNRSHRGPGWGEASVAPDGSLRGRGDGLWSLTVGGVDFEKEPERFAMITVDGKRARRNKGHVQICFTNEKNVTTAIDRIVEHFRNLEKTRPLRNTDLDELADDCSMSLVDRRGICECDACLKVAGEPPYNRDRLVWHFMNRVAKGVDARMPGRKLIILSPYFELRRPPEDVKLQPNIVPLSARFCSSTSPERGNQKYYPFTKAYYQNIRAHIDAGVRHLSCYDYMLFAGSPQPLNILDAPAAYKKLGFDRYHAEVMGRDEQRWIVLWTMSRLLWDHTQAPQALLKEYCDGYFGAGGAQALQLLKLIDESSAKQPAIYYGSAGTTVGIMTPEVTARGREILQQGKKKVTGRDAVRLERLSSTFEMWVLLAEFHRSYEKVGNAAEPAVVKEAAVKLENLLDFWKKKDLSQICSPNIIANSEAWKKKMEEKLAALAAK